MLPALFLALLLSILDRRQVPVIAVAGAVTVIATLAISATSGILLGMLAGALDGSGAAMNGDLLTVALLAGAANWAFRALPVIARTDRLALGGWLERFLSATGPAAIATLFVAAILPALTPDLSRLMPVIGGTLAVVSVYAVRRSVVMATLAGALAHGLGDLGAWLKRAV